MHVTLLTHYFPPEIGAPQVRLMALARDLAKRGAGVTVHTCFPHYPDGVLRDPYRRRLWSTDEQDGVRIVRTAVIPAPNRAFLPRVISHTSFASSALAAARWTPPADLVIAESPPLFTAAAAVPYARLKGAPLVLHVSDLWPASAVELGALRGRRAIALAARLERFCYRHAARIAVPTKGMFQRLAKLPAAAGKVVRISPAVDTDRFSPAVPARGSVLRVVYAGTIGLAQGLETLVEAARIAGPAVEIVVAGDGAEAPAVLDRMRRDRIRNVRLLGRIPHEEVARLYAEADAAVVLLRDREVFQDALPTKMLEAMAAGRPVVLAARGEAAELVQRTGAGIVVPPEDPVTLGVALLGLATDEFLGRRLGAAGRRTAIERFDRRIQLNRWWDLLHAVHGQGVGAEDRPASEERVTVPAEPPEPADEWWRDGERDPRFGRSEDVLDVFSSDALHRLIERIA